MGFRVNLLEASLALSDALDLVGVDVVQHGKRVAVLALEVGRQMGWSRPDLNEVFLGGLLHDCGVSSTTEFRHLMENLEWDRAEAHCDAGFALLSGFERFADVATLVLQHHTRWEDWGPDNTDVRTALLSNCIFLADRVDASLQLRRSADVLLLRKETCETVNVLRGSFFAPDLVRAFHGAAAREALWLTLEPHHVERYVAHVVRETRPVWIGLPEMRNLAAIFGRVVDAKSPHTAGHSAGVARLAKLLARLHDLPDEEGDLLEVAGQLHDLGRLRVPDEVLDKPGALTEAELARVQRRVFETRQVLERIGGLDPIVDWVGDHPGLLAGEVEADQVALPARILAVADVFQAMLQDRPQRKALTVREAVATMRRMARAGRLDTEVVDVLATQPESCRVAAVEEAAPAPAGAMAEA